VTIVIKRGSSYFSDTPSLSPTIPPSVSLGKSLLPPLSNSQGILDGNNGGGKGTQTFRGVLPSRPPGRAALSAEPRASVHPIHDPSVVGIICTSLSIYISYPPSPLALPISSLALSPPPAPHPTPLPHRLCSIMADMSESYRFSWAAM
jgi:hypothetical protein